ANERVADRCNALVFGGLCRARGRGLCGAAMTEGPLERRLVRGQRASGLAPHRATICLASTSGGHLAQLEAIATSLGTYDFYLVTVASAQAQSVFLGTRKHYVHRILRNPIGFVVNAAQSMGILFRERPKA